MYYQIFLFNMWIPFLSFCNKGTGKGHGQEAEVKTETGKGTGRSLEAQVETERGKSTEKDGQEGTCIFVMMIFASKRYS